MDSAIISLPDSVSYEKMQEYALDYLEDKAAMNVEHGKCGEYIVEHLFCWREDTYKIKAEIYWNRAEYVYYYVDGGKIVECVKL